MQEPFERVGGLHSYVRTLVAGQEAIGLAPVVVDRITAGGRFGVAHGDESLLQNLPADAAVEYHFAPGAFPFLYGRPGPWRNLPRLGHFHGPWSAEGRVQGNSRSRVRAKKLVEQLVYRRFQKIVVDSSAFADVLGAGYGIDPARISTVLPGIDTSRFRVSQTRSQARQALGIDHQGRLLVAVRRLEPRMGLEDAITALELIPGAHLAIAGAGSSRPGLEQLVAELGFEDRVTFLGRVSDELLPSVYRAGDVSVVPTKSLEGFGMVVLESMACGTPVVATSVGGLVEAMGPFAAEYTVPPGQPTALATTVTRALGEDSLAERVREFALTRGLAAMAAEVESVLTDLGPVGAAATTAPRAHQRSGA